MNKKITVTKRIELDYGHTLMRHHGFCSQIHGHRGKVEATIEGNINEEQGNSSQGMVLDFGILKQIMMSEVHAVLDHAFAVWKDDEADLEFIKQRNSRYLVTPEPPTAEFLAKWSYEVILAKLPVGIKLLSVRWYETPNSWADCTKSSVTTSKWKDYEKSSNLELF